MAIAASSLTVKAAGDAEPAQGQEGGETGMDIDRGSMHSLLESLIRAASYMQEEEEDRDACTDGHQEEKSGYLVDLHENRAKEAAEQQDWSKEREENMFAQRERQGQQRRKEKAEGPSLCQEAMSTPHSTQKLEDGGEGEAALQRMQSRITRRDDGEDDGAELPLLKGDEEDEEVLSRTSSRGGKSITSSSNFIPASEGMSRAEKLQAVQAEFGPSGCEGLSGEEERMLADESSALFRRVLIKGYAALTNHRLCFIAFLPGSSATHDTTRVVLAQGPATLHRPGLTRRKRKAWFVLSNHSITAYPSSDELYEPLGGFRLLDVKDVSAYTGHYRNSIAFKTGRHTCYLEFETKESASQWLKEIDVARWRLNHDVDRVRISIPLVRIASLHTEEYLQALTVLHVDVLDDSLYTSSDKQQQYHHHHRHHHVTDPNGAHTTQDIVFGFARQSSTILPQIEAALKKPTEWRSLKDKTQWWSLPSPIIEIDGPQVQPEKHEGEEDNGSMQRRIVDEFALTSRPEDVQLVKADIMRTIPSAGTLALSPRYLCFYRRHRLTGLTDTRIKIPVEHLKKVCPAKAFRWHHYGLRVQVQAHEDLVFELRDKGHRDMAMDLIRQATERARERSLSEEENWGGRDPIGSPGKALASQADRATVTLPASVINELPRAVNTDSAARPLRVDPLKVICLTIGSRGDVQPYIALCQQLQKHNHECIIVSHGEYQDWVSSHGIVFRPAGGDPGALMKLSVENKMFSPQFFRESIGKFRTWLDELLRSIMETCWDADLIIESPSTFGGIHVAEAVGCYYMRAFTMPWTKTSAYPQAFSVPNVDMGPQYNAMSYALFGQILWTASSGQVNRWRRNMLNLAPTDLAKLKTSSVPFMYNFSPAVVPPPLDWGSLIAVTGYWQLQGEEERYEPAEDLVCFLEKAKAEGKKLCYIGFGSITIQDPRGTQRAIYEAVQRSDVRAIVSKGWSDRMGGGEEGLEPLEVPEEVYTVDSIPHDWLFPQIDISMHHGGAGTTGASLGAGLVTLIHPFFGDQYFWSGRVDKLGAGIRVKSLKVDAIAEALTRARDDRVMKEKAQMVGQSIGRERGVENAVNFIYTNLARSKRVARVKKEAHQRSSSAGSSGQSHKQASTSEEAESEGEKEGGETMSRSGSLLSFNGLKQAAYHPMDTLHLGRSRSTAQPKRVTKDKQGGESVDKVVESPEEIDRQLESPGEEGRKGERSPRRRSGNLLGLPHLPAFQRQMVVPHMTLPSILKQGMGDSADRESDLTEEEKKRQESENRQKHRSAKEEDRRRREALEEVWRREKRWDLLGTGGATGEREERL